MKVFITKYALTKGILEKEAELCGGVDDMIVVRERYSSYYHKRQWYDTLQAAQARAELMRLDKIEALKKQILKLQKLSFMGKT